MSGLLSSSTMCPMGAKGILLKSCCLYIYAYALVLYSLAASCLKCFLPLVKGSPTNALGMCSLLLPWLSESGPWMCWLLFLPHFVNLYVVVPFHILFHFDALCWETLLMPHCQGYVSPLDVPVLQTLHEFAICPAHFSWCVGFHWFNQDEVPVLFVTHHYVSVPFAQDHWEFFYLVHVHYILNVIDGYTDFPRPWLWCMNYMCVSFIVFFLGLMYALLLLPHMPFLCFGWLWKVFCHCFCC